MMMPRLITRIYEDLSAVSATTVITTKFEDWLYRRYQTQSIYWNKDHHVMIAYPSHFELMNNLGKNDLADYQFQYVLGIRLLLKIEEKDFPFLALTMEKSLYNDPGEEFRTHLLRLKKAGFYVVYRANDNRSLATLCLARISQNGEYEYSVQKFMIHSESVLIINVGQMNLEGLKEISAFRKEIIQTVRSLTFENW